MPGDVRRPGGATGGSRRTPGARPSPGRGPAAGRGPDGGRTGARPSTARTGGGAGVRPGATGRADRGRPGAGRVEAPGRRPLDALAPTEALRRAKGSTRRLAILGAVLVLLALMLVPTLRAWIDQRNELADLTAKVQSQEQTVRDLEAEKARWQDPAYVEAQARQRLKFVKPGEVAYTVIGAEAPSGTDQGQVRGSVVTSTNEQLPWWTQVWRSVVLTDGLGRGTTRLGGGAPGQPTSTPTPTPTSAPTSAPTPAPTPPAGSPSGR